LPHRDDNGTPKRRLPRRLIWGVGVVAVVLLPVDAALGGVDSFAGRLASSVVGAVFGAAFALFVGAVLIDRWQAAADEAAEREADAQWNLRIRYIVRGLLEAIGRDLADIVPGAYAVVHPAVKRSARIRADDLRRSVEIPHRIEAPLADAIDQAKEVHLRMEHILERVVELRYGIQPGTTRPDEPTDAEIGVMRALFEAGTREGEQLVRQTDALHRHVSELTSYYDVEADKLLRETIDMRNDADGLNDEAEVDHISDEALVATRYALAAHGLLRDADALAGRLSSVYADVLGGSRAGVTGPAGPLEDVVESQQALMQAIRVREYELRRAGPDPEDALERARRALDDVRGTPEKEAPPDRNSE
jgi:hypothetical protein